MRVSSPFEKLLSTIINIIFVSVFVVPILSVLDISLFFKKITFLLAFFLYKLVLIFFNENRSVGMILIGLSWMKKYPLHIQILHAFLYTLSLSTLFFSIFFPFDLLLFNLIFLQATTDLLTKTTFHGFLAGMKTMKK